MTIVYGVTKYGARLQILKQLRDIPEFPQDRCQHAAHYLVAKTFSSIQKMFSTTRKIQVRIIFGICFGRLLDEYFCLQLTIGSPYALKCVYLWENWTVDAIVSLGFPWTVRIMIEAIYTLIFPYVSVYITGLHGWARVESETMFSWKTPKVSKVFVYLSQLHYLYDFLCSILALFLFI